MAETRPEKKMALINARGADRALLFCPRYRRSFANRADIHKRERNKGKRGEKKKRRRRRKREKRVEGQSM